MNRQLFASPSGLFVYYMTLLIYVFALTCMLWTTQLAYTQGQGTAGIELTVVNGTTGLPMAGQAIVLQRHSSEEGEEEILSRVVTDGLGRYNFTGLLADGSHYVVTTRHLEIPYLTEHLSLEPGAGNQEVVLSVFDITTDESVLVHSALHLVIESSPEILNIMEIIVVENRGNRTFAPPPGVGLGLTYSLPPAAFGLQPMVEGLQHTADHGLFFAAPVPPGAARIIFSYNVDRASIDHHLVKQMDYDVDRVQVLVSPSSENVVPVNLTNDGEQRVGEQDYLLLSNRVGLQGGMSVELSFPRILTWQEVMKWGMLGFVVLIVAGGLVVGFRIKPEWQPGASSLSELAAEDERKYAAIIQAIADLDTRYEEGSIEKQSYGSRRDRLKNRALKLRQSGSGDA